MNGTLKNYAKHFALGLAIAFLCMGFGYPGWGAVVATVYFWAKEIGEKCVHWDAPRRPWSDMNPLDPRWSWDDRLDLVSGSAGGWLVAWLFEPGFYCF